MFDYVTTQQYTVTVTCTDTNTNTRSADLSVDVQDNDLLEFTNLPGIYLAMSGFL